MIVIKKILLIIGIFFFLIGFTNEAFSATQYPSLSGTVNVILDSGSARGNPLYPTTHMDPEDSLVRESVLVHYGPYCMDGDGWGSECSGTWYDDYTQWEPTQYAFLNHKRNGVVLWQAKIDVGPAIRRTFEHSPYQIFEDTKRGYLYVMYMYQYTDNNHGYSNFFLSTRRLSDGVEISQKVINSSGYSCNGYTCNTNFPNYTFLGMYEEYLVTYAGIYNVITTTFTPKSFYTNVVLSSDGKVVGIFPDMYYDYDLKTGAERKVTGYQLPPPNGDYYYSLYSYDAERISNTKYRINFVVEETYPGHYDDDGTYNETRYTYYSHYIYYETASVPEVIAPIANQMFGKDGHTFIPIIKVEDSDGDQLSLKYFIDNETTPRDTKTISNTITAQTVSFNQTDVSTLTEGKHIFRFTVSDGKSTVEKNVEVFVDKTAPTLELMNLDTTESSVTITGSASDITAGLSPNPYQYSIGFVSSDWTTSSQYTRSNLMPNTAYKVKFAARDNVGYIATQEQSVQTKAVVPILAISQAAETSMELLFNDNNPAGTQYQIMAGGLYVNASGALTTTPNWIVPVNKRFTVAGLSTNTGYTFTAKSRNDVGAETSFSSQVGGTTLATPPANLTAEAAQRSIKVLWSATGGASYDIEVDSVVIDNGTSTTYLHSGLIPTTQHSYRVRVRNAGGTGNWSVALPLFTLPDPPPTPSGITTTPMQTEMTVTWDIAARAASYEVEADGVVVDAGNHTTYVHQGLQPLTDHTYRIRAKNTGGISSWSQPIVRRTLPYPPLTPAHVKAKPLIHDVTLTWDVTEGADRYEVEADGLILDNGFVTTYVHDGLDPLTGHAYRVRAVNDGGKSPWSEKLDITTHPEKPITPSNIMATSDETAITVMWYQVPNGDSYDVEIDGQTIVNAPGNSYIHTGLASESKHTYRIRAKNISGDSGWSTMATMITLPQSSGEGISLTNMAAIVTNRFITISWDTVAMAAQYDIEVDGELRSNGKDTIFQHAGLKANEFHTYKVKLKNEGNPGQWVAILSLSTLPDPPDAPEGVEAFATNNSIELRWQKAIGADGYDIEIDGKTMNVGANTNYLNAPLASGTAHTYRVRAKNITGVTAWSPSLVKSTTSPTYTVKGLKDKTFDLSLLASNVQDFSELTFEVTYNSEQLEAIDLYSYTPKADNASGKIPGSNLVVEYTPGKIVYRVKQNVVPGTSWSGELAAIVFKSKIDGQAMIDVVVK